MEAGVVTGSQPSKRVHDEGQQSHMACDTQRPLHSNHKTKHYVLIKFCHRSVRWSRQKSTVPVCPSVCPPVCPPTHLPSACLSGCLPVCLATLCPSSDIQAREQPSERGLSTLRGRQVQLVARAWGGGGGGGRERGRGATNSDRSRHCRQTPRTAQDANGFPSIPSRWSFHPAQQFGPDSARPASNAKYSLGDSRELASRQTHRRGENRSRSLSTSACIYL